MMGLKMYDQAGQELTSTWYCSQMMGLRVCTTTNCRRRILVIFPVLQLPFHPMSGSVLDGEDTNSWGYAPNCSGVKLEVACPNDINSIPNF